MLPVSTQIWVLMTGFADSGWRMRVSPFGRVSTVAVVAGYSMKFLLG
jgi:hypothetical protein